MAVGWDPGQSQVNVCFSFSMPCNMKITRCTRNYQQAWGTWGRPWWCRFFCRYHSKINRKSCSSLLLPVFSDQWRTTYIPIHVLPSVAAFFSGEKALGVLVYIRTRVDAIKRKSKKSNRKSKKKTRKTEKPKTRETCRVARALEHPI